MTMSDRIDATPVARWRHLREKGKKELVDLSSHDLINDKPVWLDEDRFARAKAAVNQYYIGVQFSSLTGLMLVLQLPDALESLLATGKSKDIPSLFQRYLSTILHVMSWYEDDIFDPETKGYKSIRQVRSMHKRVQGLMNDRHRVRDVHGREHLWMTQYDVALTQFAFIGLALLFPRKSAMIAASHEDLELINYYWRVLGYLMGVKDEFNACQFDKYDDIREFNRLILRHEYVETFEKQPCPMGLEMTKAICVALRFYIPLATFNSLAHWWSDCFSFNGYELQPKTNRDKLILLVTKLTFLRMNKSKGFLSLSNRWHKRFFNGRLTKREKVFEKLKDRHKNGPHFFSDRHDYFDRSQAQDNENNVKQAENAIKLEKEQVNSRAEQKVSPLATFNGCPFGRTFGVSKLRSGLIEST